MRGNQSRRNFEEEKIDFGVFVVFGSKEEVEVNYIVRLVFSRICINCKKLQFYPLIT